MSPISLPEEGREGSRPLIAQNVINLAKNFQLTRAQLNILNKGLTFVPTVGLDKNQKNQLQLDMQSYHRKLKLTAYFKNKIVTTTPKPFTPASIWTPTNEKIPKEIIELINTDDNDFKNTYTFHRERLNLTQEEVKALRDLRNNKHIVIKPADKGSAVVIMGRDQYIFEVQRQLNDKVYYRKLTEPIYLKTVPVVHSIIKSLKEKKFINGKQEKYLKGDREPRERKFYILPKIHKEPSKWTIPNEIPPGRPIVSDCGSETYQTAEYIDYFLNPLSIIHPSYIKDTYHFIDIIKQLKIPNNSWFFSMDVDSLYTNIDIKSGLEVIKKTFEKHPNPERPDTELLQLLEINLTKNDFVFNEGFYLQIKGTAMGKRFAPAYANIFMANWEEQVLAKCPKKPLHYFRYLDDIWGVWCYSKEDFEEFLGILNSHDPSIKLKYVMDDKSIDFLDTTVYKGPSFDLSGTLDIKVFFKETDTHALLYKTSFHPKHTFRGLLKSQLLRFYRISTQNSSFWEAVKILFGSLRKRGYSRSFLRHCLSNFNEQKLIKKEKMIPFITTYSTASRKLNRTIKHNYQTFINDKGILENCQIISAYRKNKSLRDILVRAKLEPVQQVVRAPELDCFRVVKYVRNKVDKTITRINQAFTPNSENCVYMIYCLKCGKQYIGETRNSIKMRMWQHRYNIKNRKEINTPLVKHFLFHGLKALQVTGIQANSCWTDKERKTHERQWIYRLQTREPNGLNLRHD